MKPEEVFKLYFAELKDVYAGYLSFEITMSLAIITIIGWFLTSENAQKLLIAKRVVMMCCLIGIAFTAIAELVVVYKIAKSSSEIGAIVKNAADGINPSLPKNYYDYRIINCGTIAFFYLYHVLLFILLTAIILNVKKIGEITQKT